MSQPPTGFDKIISKTYMYVILYRR